MIILCDTSSIFLLLRIAPGMFTDPRYECVTIQEVHDEIFRTQKFKDKYPWRFDFKPKVRCLGYSDVHSRSYETLYEMINLSLESGVIDAVTGHDFNLSRVDKSIVACALANKYKVASGDASLCRYAGQEFGEIFEGSVSALEVLNGWLEKKLFVWNDTIQAFLNDWKIQNEASQPPGAVKRFKELTGLSFPR
jgi:hypothetical protein